MLNYPQWRFFEMKSKKQILSIMVLLFFMGSVLFGDFAFAYSTAPISITTNSTYNKSKVAINMESPVIASVQVDSNLPGVFTNLNFRGTDVSAGGKTVPDSPDAELYYPLWNDLVNTWAYDTLTEFNTIYANAVNNSNKYGTYDISVRSEPYPIKADGSEVIIFPTSMISILSVGVDKPGIYQIWLANLAYTPANVRIIGPNGKTINFANAQLPNTQYSGGVTMGKYIYFGAFEKGDYLVYLPTSDTQIKVKCQYYAPTKVKMGVTYSEGPAPDSTEFMNPVYTLNAYSVPIGEIGWFYNYFLSVEYGSPTINGFWNTKYQTIRQTVAQGINQMLSIVSQDQVFIVIDNPNYFVWVSAGVSDSRPVRYSLQFKEIRPTEVQSGTSELVYLTKTQGATARSIYVKDPSILSIGFINKGANSPNVYSYGTNKITFHEKDGQAVYPEIIRNIDSIAAMNYYSALVEPGTYFFALSHSGSTNTEYMQYLVSITPLQSSSVLEKTTNQILSYSQFTPISVPNWNNLPDTATQGMCYGGGVKFTADTDFWNFGYNITMIPSQNPELFDQRLNSDLAVLWNTTSDTFIDYTEAIKQGNATLVPFKTIGVNNGDSFIITCETKFNAIYVDVETPAVNDNFTWQFWNGAWMTFSPATHGFKDGTNNGTCSLSQDGVISWDPSLAGMSAWAERSGGISLPNDLPDTGGRGLYHIRCLCNSSSAITPYIKSVNLRKFTRIRFDLVPFLALDLDQGDNSYYYYPISSGFSNDAIVYNSNTEPNWNTLITTHQIRFNFEKRSAALVLFANDTYEFNYNGSTTGVAQRLNTSLVFSAAIYKLINNSKVFSYQIGNEIPERYAAQQNLSALPKNASYSVNASEVSRVYIEIKPKTRYDWTQLNLNVINGSVSTANIIYPAAYNQYTMGSLITMGGGIYNTNTFVERQASAALNFNMSMDFGLISEKIYLELVISTSTPAFLTIINIDARQFGYPVLNIGLAEGLPTWALVLIIAGAVCGVSALLMFLYKKKHPLFNPIRSIKEKIPGKKR